MIPDYIEDIPSSIFVNGYEYRLFIPIAFKHFVVNYKNMTWRKHLRFLYQFLHGNIIFYMLVNNNIVGYVVLECGNSVRYPNVKNEDWIISTYSRSQYERKGVWN